MYLLENQVFRLHRKVQTPLACFGFHSSHPALLFFCLFPAVQSRKTRGIPQRDAPPRSPRRQPSGPARRPLLQMW